MMIVVLGGLFLLDLYIVPASIWWEGIKGFVTFGYVPQGVDVLLLGALVGYSAYGGFGNNAITNWYRDKGYGMGAKIGYIPAAIGGKVIHVSPHGKVPMPTEKNLSSWRGWWKLLEHRSVGRFLLWSDDRDVPSWYPLCCRASKGINASKLGNRCFFCQRSHLKDGQFWLVPRSLLSGSGFSIPRLLAMWTLSLVSLPICFGFHRIG